MRLAEDVADLGALLLRDREAPLEERDGAARIVRPGADLPRTQERDGLVLFEVEDGSVEPQRAVEVLLAEELLGDV